MDDPQGRFCVVCGRVLEQLLSDGPTVYRHAQVDLPEDHLPIAVRPQDAPAQVRYRCDFCLAEPVTHTLVADKELGIPEANIWWDTEWAMCATCSGLALADDWVNLRRHAFAAFAREHGELQETTKAQMRLVYRDLRAATVMFYQEPL